MFFHLFCFLSVGWKPENEDFYLQLSSPRRNARWKNYLHERAR
jgi:hypothetical protein